MKKVINFIMSLIVIVSILFAVVLGVYSPKGRIIEINKKIEKALDKYFYTPILGSKNNGSKVFLHICKKKHSGEHCERVLARINKGE